MLEVIRKEVILGMELRVFGDVENPLFLAKEIASHIEYSSSNISKMLELVDDEEEKVKFFGEISESTKLTSPTESRVVEGATTRWFLTEEGVYSVLMKSNVQKAKEFRKGFKSFLKTWRKGEVAVVSTKDSLLLSIMKADSDVNRAVAISKYEEEYVKPLEIENKALTKEVEHKEDVIIGLVSDIDLATKRQRITQVVKNGSKNYKDRYALLYKEFELKYHVSLNRRLNSESVLAVKPKVKTKMDLIDRVLGMIPELYEIACVIFETDMKEIIKRFEK